MWNQNNGNGYGQQPQYGYGNEDVYGRLNNTREVGGPRFPYIEAGTHRLALCTLEEFPHRTDGPSARALFKVLASSARPDGKPVHAPGSFVAQIWKLVKPPKFPETMPSDGDLFADFCRKLKGAPAGYAIGNDIRTLMKERAAEQLARGTVIECVASLNKKGTWTNRYWTNVQQTPQDIAAMRAQLEAEGIPNTSDNHQAVAPMPQASQQQYQMSPQQYQVPQGAPPPAQYTPYQAPVAQPVQQGFLGQQIPPQGNQGKW